MLLDGSYMSAMAALIAEVLKAKSETAPPITLDNISGAGWKKSKETYPKVIFIVVSIFLLQIVVNNQYFFLSTRIKMSFQKYQYFQLTGIAYLTKPAVDTCVTSQTGIYGLMKIN
jgi:hypothetical protein